jgi:hypothetical protein
MRVTVAGTYKEPILLDTKDATAVLVEFDDGQPAVILRMLPNKQGYLRLFKGEDQSFDEQARQLGLKSNK